MIYTEQAIKESLRKKDLSGLLVLDDNKHTVISWLIKRGLDELLFDLLALLERDFQGSALSMYEEVEKNLSTSFYVLTLLFTEAELQRKIPKLLNYYHTQWQSDREQALAQFKGMSATTNPKAYSPHVQNILRTMPYALDIFYENPRMTEFLFNSLQTNEDAFDTLIWLMDRIDKECWFTIFRVVDSRGFNLLMRLFRRGKKECLELTVKLLDKHQFPEEDDLETLVDVLNLRFDVFPPIFIDMLLTGIEFDEEREELKRALTRSPAALKVLIVEKIIIPEIHNIGGSTDVKYAYSVIMSLLDEHEPEELGNCFSSSVQGKLFLCHLYNMSLRVEDGKLISLFSKLRAFEQIELLKLIHASEGREAEQLVSDFFPVMHKATYAFQLAWIMGVGEPVSGLSSQTITQKKQEAAALLKAIESTNKGDKVNNGDLKSLCESYWILMRNPTHGSPLKTEDMQLKQEVHTNLLQSIRKIFSSKDGASLILNIAELSAYVESLRPNWAIITAGATSRLGKALRKLERFSYESRVRQRHTTAMQNALTLVVYQYSNPSGFASYIQSGPGGKLLAQVLDHGGREELSAMILGVVFPMTARSQLFFKIKDSTIATGSADLLAVAECYIRLGKWNNKKSYWSTLIPILENILRLPESTSHNSTYMKQLLCALHLPAWGEDDVNRPPSAVMESIKALQKLFPPELSALTAKMTSKQFIETLKPIPGCLDDAESATDSVDAAAGGGGGSATDGGDMPATPRRLSHRAKLVSLTTPSPVRHRLSAVPMTPHVRVALSVRKSRAIVGVLGEAASIIRERRENAEAVMQFLHVQPSEVMNILQSKLAAVAFFDAIRFCWSEFQHFLSKMPLEYVEDVFLSSDPLSGDDVLGAVVPSDSGMTLLPIMLNMLDRKSEAVKVAVLSNRSGDQSVGSMTALEKIIVTAESANLVYIYLDKLMGWFESKAISDSNMMLILAEVIQHPVIYNRLTEDLFLLALTGAVTHLKAELLGRLATVVENKFPNYRWQYAAATAKAFFLAARRDSSPEDAVVLADDLMPEIDEILSLRFDDTLIFSVPFLSLTAKLERISVEEMSQSVQKVIVGLRRLYAVSTIGETISACVDGRRCADVDAAATSLRELHPEILVDVLLVKNAANYLLSLLNKPKELADLLKAAGDRVFEILGQEFVESGCTYTLMGQMIAQQPEVVAVIRDVITDMNSENMLQLFYRSCLDARRGPAVEGSPFGMTVDLMKGMQTLSCEFSIESLFWLLNQVVLNEDAAKTFALNCLRCLETAIKSKRSPKQDRDKLAAVYRMANIFLSFRCQSMQPEPPRFPEGVHVSDEDRMKQQEYELVSLVSAGLADFFPIVSNQETEGSEKIQRSQLLVVLSVINFSDGVWLGLNKEIVESIQFLQSHCGSDDLASLISLQIQHADTKFPVYNKQLVLWVINNHPQFLPEVLANQVLTDVIEQIMKYEPELFGSIIETLRDQSDFFIRTSEKSGTVLHRAAVNPQTLKIVLDKLDQELLRGMMTQLGVSGYVNPETPSTPWVLAVRNKYPAESRDLLYSLFMDEQLRLAQQVEILKEPFNDEEFFIQQDEVKSRLTREFAIALVKYAYEHDDYGLMNHVPYFGHIFDNRFNRYYYFTASALLLKKMKREIVVSKEIESTDKKRIVREIDRLYVFLQECMGQFEQEGEIDGNKHVAAFLVSIASEPAIRENREWSLILANFCYYFSTSERVIPDFKDKFARLQADIKADIASSEADKEDPVAREMRARKERESYICDKVIRLIHDLYDSKVVQQPGLRKYLALSLRLSVILQDAPPCEEGSASVSDSAVAESGGGAAISDSAAVGSGGGEKEVSETKSVRSLLEEFLGKLPLFTDETVKDEFRFLDLHDREYVFGFLELIVNQFPQFVTHLFTHKAGMVGLEFAISRRPERFKSIFPALVDLYPDVLHPLAESKWTLLHQVVTRNEGELTKFLTGEYRRKENIDAFISSLGIRGGELNLTPLQYAFQVKGAALNALLRAIKAYIPPTIALTILNSQDKLGEPILCHPEVVEKLGDDYIEELMKPVVRGDDMSRLQIFVPIIDKETPLSRLLKLYVLSDLRMKARLLQDSTDLFQGQKKKFQSFLVRAYNCLVDREAGDLYPLQMLLAIVTNLPERRGSFTQVSSRLVSAFADIPVPEEIRETTLTTA